MANVLGMPGLARARWARRAVRLARHDCCRAVPGPEVQPVGRHGRAGLIASGRAWAGPCQVAIHWTMDSIWRVWRGWKNLGRSIAFIGNSASIHHGSVAASPVPLQLLRQRWAYTCLHNIFFWSILGFDVKKDVDCVPVSTLGQEEIIGEVV